jgi:hypothetical protein
VKLLVRVSPGTFRDGLWRSSDGLAVELRIAPESPHTEEYLLKFLSGSLRVAPGLMVIQKGPSKNYRSVTVNVSDTDLQPILAGLPPVPQAKLFED